MSKAELERLLKDKLSLKQPTFRLEKVGAKLSGSVISETFRGKTARQRQTMVWDALDAQLGAGATQEVGTLLLYAPEEWDVPLAGAPKAKAS
jgi:acid stress-induced BolA-like protein IbaG/YrbA